MDAERWQRMQELFHAALDLPVDERHEFLEAACKGDEQLLQEVVALLEEDEGNTSFLEPDLAQVARAVLDGSVPVLHRIGPYRIGEVLGQGGMGVVYLAERDDLQSRAAIKVLRDATLSPSRRERFAREQQMLAQLTHPSIARLYDADVLADGTPYFVMEYVDGMPLTDYCRLHECSIGERLDLFAEVCEAVQYAHGQAVIHRDLKPSNIFVCEGPHGEPSIKLLDFGIAKQLDEMEASAVQTQTGLRLMTPAYAAPEQVRGGPVGVYTDVYALGVVLYELLTGELPFDLSGLTPGQVEAAILEQKPEKPSAKAPEATTGAGAGADLDVLALTAMHEDPQRRYGTVEALLRDLEHYREGRPLEARPDSPTYRAAKFLRRNRHPVAAAVLVWAVVTGLVAFYTMQLAEARDAALAEAARTQRIQQFMFNLFADDGTVGPADSLRVTTLLHRGVREARALENEPDVQAALYETLGGLYQQLGDFGQADSLLHTALNQRRDLFGTDHPQVAQSLVALGRLRVDQAEFDEAETLIRQGLEAARHQLPSEHPAVAEAVTALGYALVERGEYERAIEILREAVRLRTVDGPASVELSESLTQLANAHFYAGDYATSDSLNRLVLALDQRLYGRRHPYVANSLVNLGASLEQLGYRSEAEQRYRQALEIVLPYHGPDHHETASIMMMLAQTLAFQERYDEALELLRPALDVRERVYGSEHPRVATTLNVLGTVALRQGDLQAAEGYFRRMTDIYRAAYAGEHYYVGIGLSNLATVYARSERYDRAEGVLRQAVTMFAEALSPEHVNTAIARIKLGGVLLDQGRHDEAEEHLLAGYKVVAAQANPSMSWLQSARENLVAVYEVTGRSEQAEHFRREIAAVSDER